MFGEVILDILVQCVSDREDQNMHDFFYINVDQHLRCLANSHSEMLRMCAAAILEGKFLYQIG